jgi:hypothetical protein
VEGHPLAVPAARHLPVRGRQQKRRAAERYEDLFDGLEVGVIVVDILDGRLGHRLRS